MKKIMAFTFSSLVILLGVPMSFQAIYYAQEAGDESVNGTHLLWLSKGEAEEEIMVPVFREELNEHQELLLEEYLVGVVAAEMPARFEDEALKAQAISARTYTLRVLETEPYILDTVQHQVFKDEGQLRERWGNHFDEHYAKIKKAVEETKGLVMTYNENLINPLFFSISNGRTENSEDYFSTHLPYLRAVDSEWDKNVEDFEVETSFSLSDLQQLFNDASLTINSFEIISRTEGGNVQEIVVGDKTYSGREFREKLELRSSDFSFNYLHNTIYITTYGYGHGVGMSQTGANELAKMGKTYQDILNHYYQDINIIENNSLN